MQLEMRSNTLMWKKDKYGLHENALKIIIIKFHLLEFEVFSVCRRLENAF